MSCLDLNTASPTELHQQISNHQTIVACLCAAWCDVCTSYRIKFEEFARHHPEHLFLWVDVEDQAEIAGDFEIDNFPTLLIQRHGVVTFFGPMEPETKQLKLLLHSQAHHTVEQLQKQNAANEQQRLWQVEANLLKRLNQQI